MSLIKKYRKQFAAVTISIGAISVAPIDVNATDITVTDEFGAGKIFDPATASAGYVNIEQLIANIEIYKGLASSSIDGIDVPIADKYVLAADRAAFDAEMAKTASGNDLFAQLTDIQSKLTALLAFDGSAGSLADDAIKTGTKETYQASVGTLITQIQAAYNALTASTLISYTDDGSDLANGSTYVTLTQYNALKTAIEDAFEILILAHATHYDDDPTAGAGTQETAFTTLVGSGTTGAGAFAELFGNDAIAGADDTHKTLAEINIAIDGTNVDGDAHDATDGGIKKAITEYGVTATTSADGAIITERAAIAFELLKAKASLGLDLAAALPTADVTEGNIATVFANAGKVFAVNDTATPPTVTVATAAPASPATPLYAPMVIADNASSDTVGSVNHDFNDDTPDMQLNYVTLSEANATIAKIRALEAKLLDYDGMDDTTTTNALTLYTDELITNEINEDTLDNLTEVKEDIEKEVKAFERIQKEGTGANKNDRAKRIVALLDHIEFENLANADGTETGGLVTGGTTWAKGISLMSAELEDMEDYSTDDEVDASTPGAGFTLATVSHLYGIDVPATDTWVTPSVHDALYKVAKEARIQYEIYTGKAYVTGGTGTDATKYPNRATLAKTQTLEDLEDAAADLDEAITDYLEEVAAVTAKPNGTQGKFTTAFATFWDGTTAANGALSAARDLLNADGTFKAANHYISEYGLTYVNASGTITPLKTDSGVVEQWATQAEVTAFNNVLLKADKIKEAVDLFTTAGDRGSETGAKVAYSIPKVGDVITITTAAGPEAKTVTKEQVALINTIISKFGDEDGEYDDQGYFEDEVDKIETAKELFVIKAENATAFTTGITELATAIGAEGTPADSSGTPAVAGTGARGLLGANTTFGETALDSKIYISADGYLYGDDSATADTLIPAPDSGEEHKWVPLSAVTAFDTAIKAVETKKATLDKALTDATLTPATKKELALIINAADDFELDADYFTELVEGLTDKTDTFTRAAKETTDTSDALHTELTALKGDLATAITTNLDHDATDATAPTLKTPAAPLGTAAADDSATVAVSNNGLTNEDGTAFATGIANYVTRANFDAFVTEIKAAIALRDDNVTAQVAKHKKDKEYLKTAKTTLSDAVTAYGTNTIAIKTSGLVDAYETDFKGILEDAREKVDATGAVSVLTNIYKSEYGLTYDDSGTITAIPNGKHWVTEAVVTAFNDVLKQADEIQLAVELFKVAGTRTGGAKEAYSIPAVGDSITPANPSGSTAVTVTQAHIDKINEVLAAYSTFVKGEETGAPENWFAAENTKITTADQAFNDAKKLENVTALTAQTDTYGTDYGTASALLETGYADRGITTTKTDGSEAYISEDGMTYVVTTTTGSGEAATTTKTTTAIPSGKKYVTPTEVATFERALTTANELKTKLTDVTTLTDTKILDAIIKDGALNADYFTSTADPKGVIVKLNDAKAAFAAAAKDATGGAFTTAYDAFALKIKEAIEDNVVNYTADATDGKHTLTPTAGNVLTPTSGIFVSDNGISVIKGAFTAGDNYVTENEFEDLIDEIQEAIDVRDKSIDQLVRSYDFNNSYFDNLVTKLDTALQKYTAATAKVEKKTQFLAAVDAAFGTHASGASPNITAKLSAQIGDPLADPATKDITYTYEAATATPSDSSVSLDLDVIVVSENGFTDVDGAAVGDDVKWITPKMEADLADAILELEDIREAALYDGTTVIEALAEKQEEVIDDYLDALGADGTTDGYFINLINGTGSGSGSGGTGNTTALEDAIAEFKPAASNAGEFTKLKAKLGELVNGTLLGTAVDNNGDGDELDQGEVIETVWDDAWDAKILVDKFKFGLKADGSLDTADNGLSRVSDDKGNDTLTLARLEVINGNALVNAQTNTTATAPTEDEITAAKKFYQYVTTATLTKLETALTKATDYKDNTLASATASPAELKNLQAEIKALEDAMTAFEASIVDLSSAENKNPREWLYELMVEAYKKKYIDINGTLTLVEKSDVGGVDIEEGHYWVKTATYDWFEAELAKSLLVLKDIDTDGNTALPANTEALNASIKVVNNASKYFVPAVSKGNSEYNTAKAEAFKALNVLVKQMGYTGLTSDAEGTVTDTEITADDIAAAFTPVANPDTVADVLYRPSEKFGYEVPVSKTWIPKKNFDEAKAKLETWAAGMIKSTTPVATFNWYTTEITKWDDLFVKLSATNHGTGVGTLNPTDEDYKKTFKYLIDEITKYSAIIEGDATKLGGPIPSGLPKIVGTTTEAIKTANQEESLGDNYWGDVAMDTDNGSYTAQTNYWAKKLEITPILDVYNNTIKWWLNTDNFDISGAPGSEKINHNYATLKKAYDKIKTTFESFYGKDLTGATVAGITPKLYAGTDGKEHESITASIKEANEFMKKLHYTHAATVPTTTYTLEDGTPNQQYTHNENGEFYVSGLTNGSDVPKDAGYYTQTFINSYVAAIKKAQNWLDLYERNPLTVKTVDLKMYEKALTDLTDALESNKKISTIGNTVYTEKLTALNEAIENAYAMIDVDPASISRASNGTFIKPSYNGEGAEVSSLNPSVKWVPISTYNWYKDTVIKQAEAGRDQKGATAAQLNTTLTTLTKNTNTLTKGAKPGTQEAFKTAQVALANAIKDVDDALNRVIPSAYYGNDVKKDQEWVPSTTYTWLKGLNNKAISIYDLSYESETLDLNVSVSKASTIDATKKTVKKADLVAQTTTLTKSLATFEATVKQSKAEYAKAQDKEDLRLALDKFKKDLASIVYSKNKNGTDVSAKYAWVSYEQVTLASVTGSSSNYVKATLQAAYDTANKEYLKKPADTTADFAAAKTELDKYQAVLDGILGGSLDSALTDKAGSAGSLETVATARTALGEKLGEAAAVIKGVHSIDVNSATGDELLKAIYPVLDGQYYASSTAIQTINDKIADTKVLYNQKVTSGTTLAATATDLNTQTTDLQAAIDAFKGVRVLVQRSVAGNSNIGGIDPASIEIVTLTMGDGNVITLEHEIDQSLPEFDQPILIELPATDNYDDFSLDLEEEIFEELPDSAPEVEVPEIEIPEIEIPEIEVPEIEIPEIEIPEIEDPDITTLEIAPEEEYYEEEVYEEEYYEEEVYEEEYYEEEYYEENYYEEDYYEEEYYEEEIIEEVYEEIIEEIEIEEIEIEEIEVEEIEVEEIEVEEIEVEEIVIEEIAKSSPISKFFKKIFRL